MKPRKTQRIEPLMPMSKALTEREAEENKIQNDTVYSSFLHPHSMWRTLTGLSVLFFVLVGLTVGYYRETRLPFDSARWKANTDRAIYMSVRERMCDDLLPRLRGRSRSEVVQMLGSSEEESGKTTLIYYIGAKRILDIEFNQQQKVEQVQIRDFT